MIKLTRGALTMLLAQYRGILKNAWIKNFAVAAALATTVTSAYADGPAKDFATWDEGVAASAKDAAVKLNGQEKDVTEGEATVKYSGTLNIQADKEWQKEPSTIVITGGEGHKIGVDGDANLFAEKKNKDKYPTGNITIDTTGKDASAAVLTIGGEGRQTGVALNRVEVKAKSVGDVTANLTVKNKPASSSEPSAYDDDQYTNIQKLTVDGANASVNVTNGELDVNENLTIKGGASLTANENSILWVGINDVDAPSVNVENGTLTSNGELYIDSSKLTVGKDSEGKATGVVNVQGTLNLADVGPVNINTLTDVGEGKKGEISLTGDTTVTASNLILDKANTKVKNVIANNLTLGGADYKNTGIGANAVVTTKLTASAVEGDAAKTATYKINKDESITLNTAFKADHLGNDTGVGTVASDLEVAGGTLNVQAGTWNAEGLKVSEGKESAKSTVTVESNAALALKTLEIANGQTLSVKQADSTTYGEDAKAGVLDLTNTKLVNATGEGASDAQRIIANAGVVKITSDKLNAAIANEDKNKGYIFDNKAGAEIQVAGPATLATKAFLSSDSADPGIKNVGTLAVNGALTVKGDDKVEAELKNAGTIKAASLQLNGKEGGAKNEGAKSKFTLGVGTYEIAGAVGANTDTLAIDTGANVKAQSIGARILEISGQVGADKANVGSINATDSLETKTGSKVFADSITAGSINFDGQVTAGNVASTKGLTVTAGTHKFGDVTDTSDAGIVVKATDKLEAGKLTAKKLSVTAGTLNLGDVNADDIEITEGTIGVSGALDTKKLQQDAGTLTVTKGSLTATNASVKGVALNNATANIGTLAVASDTENALTLEKSTATVGSFDGTGAKAGSISVGEGSTLTISATQHTATDKAIFKNNASGDAIKGDGTLAVNADALGLEQNVDKTDYKSTNHFAENSVGVLKINGAASAIGADKINDTNLRKLVKALSVSGDNDFGGKLQLDGVTADISGLQKVTTDAKNGSYLKSEVEVFNKLAGDTTLQSVTVDAGAGDDAAAVSGDVGNLVIDAGKTEATIAEATLQGSGSAAATNGYYVSAVKGDDAKKVVLAGAALKDADSSLTLAGAGKIGAVTAKTADAGALNVTGNASVVKVDTNGKEVAADIGASDKKLAKVNVSGALTANDIFTNALESSGSVVAAKIEAGKATVEGGVVNATNLKTSGVANIKAGSVNVDNAEFTGALTMEGGALTATAVKDGPSGKVTLKEVSEIKAGSITAKDLVAEKALTSAGNITADKLDAQSKVDLKGGVVNAKEVTLGGDTSITGGASLVADKVTAEASGTLKDIFVGKDAVGDVAGSAGFFFAKDLVKAGKLVVDPEFSNITSLAGVTAFDGSNVLTTNIEVGQNAIFAYDENLTVEQLKSLTSKYNLSDAANGIGSLLVVNSAIDLGAKGIAVGKNGPAAEAGKLTLGKNGALAVGGTALANAKVNANNSQEAAVDATTGGVKFADSAKVLLDGPVKAGAQYQIFKAGANGVKNADAASDKKLTASSLNGFYTATINEDGKTTKVNANRGVMYQMTEPLYQHMLAVTGNGNTGAGVQFLEKTASEARDGGKDAETVARLGAFGGLYNAAFNVNKSSTDAIAARMTMGNNGVQQVATNNTVGGAVWLSPVYKNVKADTFESDGKESGADVKLTGIALGGDVTTANNIRLGVMFNLGSGDTDGNNLGSSVENDFDYYGFGAYAGYSFGNFAVAADATYAKVDNDLSAVSGTGYGYFKSSVDTNVYSLGLTAKYAFNTDFATITPHLGVRYTSLNADSYDVQSSYGVLATTSYDSAKVVSFPAGVTLTRDIKLNAWKLQPTFDVTLTANTGDTEATYNTYFTGANSKVKLESEFADSFTYGLAAGIEAQHENGLALGLGVTYEGSSNTNSYGVTGNVRYTF